MNMVELEGRRAIIPFYFLYDCSENMGPHMSELQRHINRLQISMGTDPLWCEATMMGVITFGATAETVVPLGAPDEIRIPALASAGNESRVSDALEQYASAFSADLAMLRERGILMYRPIVFLLLAGMGDDGWNDTFRRLLTWDPHARTGNRMYPYLIALGIGDHVEAEVKALAYPNVGDSRGRWYAISGDIDEALSTAFHLIEEGVVGILRTFTSAQPQSPSSDHSIVSALPLAGSMPTVKTGVP